MDKRTCSVDDCESPVSARDWCSKHYQRWAKTRNLYHERPPAGVCAVPDCERPIAGSGYCGKHYQRWRRYGDPLITQRPATHDGSRCAAEGCGKRRRKREWCDTHYQRWVAHGDPYADKPITNRNPITGLCIVDGCTREQNSRGRCLMHYKWWRNHGTDTRPTLADRLWAHVAKGPDCWVWTGAVRGMGYGRITTNYRTVPAHRLSWELAYGPIPDGLDVLHHCDNPPCVRPDHLFLGTDADNAADKMAKGRGNNTHSGRGKKLTWNKVTAMRAEMAAGAPKAAIAKKYGVSESMVYLIASQKAWDPKKRLHN